MAGGQRGTGRERPLWTRTTVERNVPKNTLLIILPKGELIAEKKPQLDYAHTLFHGKIRHSCVPEFYSQRISPRVVDAGISPREFFFPSTAHYILRFSNSVRSLRVSRPTIAHSRRSAPFWQIVTHCSRFLSHCFGYRSICAREREREKKEVPRVRVIYCT